MGVLPLAYSALSTCLAYQAEPRNLARSASGEVPTLLIQASNCCVGSTPTPATLQPRETAPNVFCPLSSFVQPAATLAPGVQPWTTLAVGAGVRTPPRAENPRDADHILSFDGRGADHDGHGSARDRKCRHFNIGRLTCTNAQRHILNPLGHIRFPALGDHGPPDGR